LSTPPTKYEVPIFAVEKPARIPREVTTQLKGVVSGKVMGRMKKEAVRCPVVNDEVTFLVCFTCPSFLRRVKGVVHCAGLNPPTYYKPSKK
jgi:hypothetical protein